MGCLDLTCIVGGIEPDGSILLGGDSCAAGGTLVSARRESKVFLRNGYAIGYTTSFRMGQLLNHMLEVSPPPDGEDVTRWMVCHFIEAVRGCLRRYGWSEKEKERDSGGDFLVGVRGRLYYIYSDFQVEENLDDYHACGCGAQIAHGVMYATRDMRMNMEERITMSLEAAAHHTKTVMPPFNMVRLCK